MSFKDFSIAQKAPAQKTPGEDGAADKSKEAAATKQPATVQKPAAKS